MSTDLFGQPYDESKLPSARPIREKQTGHAWKSGSGPAGETCKSCKHYVHRHYHGYVYRKCGLMEAHWTRGPGTDIRARDPACKFWEAAE